MQKALFEMSVWNTFDPTLISDMYDKKPVNMKVSIAEKIRLRAANESRKRRRHLRTGSFGFLTLPTRRPITMQYASQTS